ncbi:MAG: hypothetical protein Q9217_007054 [Psora testacea]
MGKLIKNHWARLIILTAATYQILASLHAFFWPKFFFDFLTTNLDPIVRPIPILQVINLLLGILGLCWEWPLPIFISASTSYGLSHNKAKRSTTSDIATTTTTTPGRTGDATKAALKVADAQASNHKASASTASTSENQTSPLHRILAGMHRSIEARLVVYPLSSLAALLLYQGTNAGLYYIIGMGVYFWAFSEGEVVMGVPWTLPRRGKRRLVDGSFKV